MNWVQKLQLRLRGPLRPVVRFFLFFYYQTHFVDGAAARLHVGKRAGLCNTVFNVSSGSIYVGDHVIFGYNVMVLTGRHQFVDGRRASLAAGVDSDGWGGGEDEVPSGGYDIRIGDGTWIASGAIITGGVTIGMNVIVAANAVVTMDVPDYSIVAGTPARVIGDTRNLGRKGEGSHIGDAVRGPQG
jgi:acetyltransferase-like isoleucine patch superfamily enzyme